MVSVQVCRRGLGCRPCVRRAGSGCPGADLVRRRAVVAGQLVVQAELEPARPLAVGAHEADQVRGDVCRRGRLRIGSSSVSRPLERAALGRALVRSAMPRAGLDARHPARDRRRNRLREAAKRPCRSSRRSVVDVVRVSCGEERGELGARLRLGQRRVGDRPSRRRPTSASGAPLRSGSSPRVGRQVTVTVPSAAASARSCPGRRPAAGPAGRRRATARRIANVIRNRNPDRPSFSTARIAACGGRRDEGPGRARRARGGRRLARRGSADRARSGRPRRTGLVPGAHRALPGGTGAG